jgi:RimJ/RimL family protein N-acetyltransferase
MPPPAAPPPLIHEQAAPPLPETRPVLLLDGTLVQTRPIRPADGPALQRFHSRLSAQSVYLRFFRSVPVLSAEQARYYTELDGQDRFALVGLDPAQPEEIIGVVRYDREPGTDRAEYAIVVADAWQGRGLGLGLTRRLLVCARHQGIRHLYAYILPENRRMLELFKRLGLNLHADPTVGIVRVELDLWAGRNAPEHKVKSTD